MDLLTSRRNRELSSRAQMEAFAICAQVASDRSALRGAIQSLFDGYVANSLNRFFCMFVGTKAGFASAPRSKFLGMIAKSLTL